MKTMLLRNILWIQLKFLFFCKYFFFGNENIRKLNGLNNVEYKRAAVLVYRVFNVVASF